MTDRDRVRIANSAYLMTSEHVGHICQRLFRGIAPPHCAITSTTRPSASRQVSRGSGGYRLETKATHPSAPQTFRIRIAVGGATPLGQLDTHLLGYGYLNDAHCDMKIMLYRY